MPYAALRQKMRVSLECQAEEEKEEWRRAGLVAYHVLLSIPHQKGQPKKPSWKQFQRQLGILDDHLPADFDRQEEIRKAYRVLQKW